MNKIFGSLSPFHITDSDGNFQGPHLGARVACTEFQNNVIRHGGFDCCHFLLGRRDHSDEDIAKYIDSHNWDPGTILIYDGALPLDRLAKSRYHVIHKPDLGLCDILRLRHALAKPLAPATAMNHTLSYAFLMTQWMDLLLGHVLPCDVIVCTSKASREVIETSFELLSERLSSQLGVKAPTFRGCLEIIPLGVDVEYWKPASNKTEAKRLLELPEQSCLILCPARFSSYDKMDLRPLLIAIKRLLGILGPDFFRVVLVGDDTAPEGSESKLIKAYVDELGLTQVVKIDTNGSPSRIRQYYGAADIFVSVVDNLQETFGLTVVQAMACGLPTVVSDWNGYKDTVIHGETGFRVRTYWTDCDNQISSLGQLRYWKMDQLLLAQSVAVDIDEIFFALHNLVIAPELRRRFGEASRKRAEELYAWPVVIGQYRELWDNCREKFNHIDHQEWIREDHAGIFDPAYFRRFRHYPSEIISSETQLAVLSTGAELASTPNPPQEVHLPPAMGPVFHPTVFQSLMSKLSDWPVMFGPLVEDVSCETGYPRDLVARQTMWLIKYGVLKPVKTIMELSSVSGEAAVVQEDKATTAVASNW